MIIEGLLLDKLGWMLHDVLEVLLVCDETLTIISKRYLEDAGDSNKLVE